MVFKTIKTQARPQSHMYSWFMCGTSTKDELGKDGRWQPMLLDGCLIQSLSRVSTKLQYIFYLHVVKASIPRFPLGKRSPILYASSKHQNQIKEGGLINLHKLSVKHRDYHSTLLVPSSLFVSSGGGLNMLLTVLEDFREDVGGGVG